MRITMRVRGEDPGLVLSLQKLGIEARLVRNAVIVKLPSLQNREFQIPPEVKGKGALCIRCTENGGGKTRTGRATVVCSPGGRPMRPYFMPGKGHLACGTHAFFAVSNVVVTVTSLRLDPNFLIEKHRICVQGNVAAIRTQRLWYGTIEELPKVYERFGAAAEAALEKSDCYHCRCVHYYAEA